MSVGRRLVVPALVSAAGWFLPFATHRASDVLMRRHIDAFVDGIEAFPTFLLVPYVGWLTVPLVFVGIHLCRARGGKRWEYVLVGCIPLVLAGADYLLQLAAVTQDGTTPGERMVVLGGLWPTVGGGGLCAATLWLYAFARRHLRENSSASDRQSVSTPNDIPPTAVSIGDE